MKLQPDDLIELMALADGELDGSAKARAEGLRASDPGAAEVFRHMQSAYARTLLAEALDAHAARCGADEIAGAVVARLDGSIEHRSELRNARLVTHVAPAAERRWWARVPVFAKVGGTAMAIAAAVALYVAVRTERSGTDHQLARLPTPSPVASLARMAAAMGGVDLDEIDSPTHDVSVFEISALTAQEASGKSHSSSVVIWIDEPGTN